MSVGLKIVAVTYVFKLFFKYLLSFFLFFFGQPVKYVKHVYVVVGTRHKVWWPIEPAILAAIGHRFSAKKKMPTCQSEAT